MSAETDTVTPDLAKLRDEYLAWQKKLDDSDIERFRGATELFRTARRRLSRTEFRLYVRDLGWRPTDAYALMNLSESDFLELRKKL
jgi:hypothetical protein